MNPLAEPKPAARLGATRIAAAEICPHAMLQRLRAALRRWWQYSRTDDLNAYLSQAENAVDLEYRIRHWNECDRRDRMPLR